MPTERITLYLGYKDTGTARNEFLASKAKERGYKSISELVYALITKEFKDYPKR